jgi:hypothetical protein
VTRPHPADTADVGDERDRGRVLRDDVSRVHGEFSQRGQGEVSQPCALTWPLRAATSAGAVIVDVLVYHLPCCADQVNDFGGKDFDSTHGGYPCLSVLAGPRPLRRRLRKLRSSYLRALGLSSAPLAPNLCAGWQATRHSS